MSPNSVPRNSNEYLWVSNVIRAVEKLSGRPSGWNGELDEETRPGVGGNARDDGSMRVNVEKILKPVALAYTAGRPLTEDELFEVREAVLTVVHEAEHLSHPLGDENAAGATPAYSLDTWVLEEGLTENWAHRNVDAVIRDLGMHVANPELLTTESVDSYPACTAATDELIKGTAQVTGLPPNQVRTALEQADRSQRWAVAADLVIDTQMADVLPAQDREAVRTQLVQAMRPHFAAVVSTQQSTIESDVGKTIAGHQSGQRAVIALSTTAAEIEAKYRDQPAASGEVEHLRKFLGGPGPTGTYRAEGQQHGAVPDNVRQLHAQRDQGQGRE